MMWSPFNLKNVMVRARKAFLLFLVGEDEGRTLLGVFSSCRRALVAMRADATQHARDSGQLEGSHIEFMSKEECRLVLPDGDGRHYLVQGVSMDSTP